uniref:Uncharacterized protein n=1 Tax=Tanacetum cinerariifolium TaxID=118510 RepID=A0A6L2KZR4_TANCI|nr:hypothetical protein [Tanacetum cinerariifolium]
MDDPDLTMEEYIKLKAKKARRHGRIFNWETATYGKGSYFDDFDYLKDFENEFPTIVYNDALTSDQFPNPRRLRCQMSWKEFILALGLYMVEEMASEGFRAYWAGSSREIAAKANLRDYWTEISSVVDFLNGVPSYTAIWDLLMRLCHCLMAFSISKRGQAPEKVTTTDLFYLRRMDQGAVNLPYLLAIYLFRHAEGRKGQIVVIPDLTRIDIDELVRLCIYEWVDPKIAKEGAQAVLTHVQPPPRHQTAALALRTMP